MKKTIFAIACGLALGLPAANADMLTVGSAGYVGHLSDGAPANLASEVTYINYLLTLNAGATAPQIPPTTGETYDRLGSTLDASGLPAAVEAGATQVVTPGGNPHTGINVTGFSYILGKYDGHNIGAGSYVWYIAGQTTVDLPQYLPNPAQHKYAMSHYALFNPVSVPDGGMTLVLLGGALVGLEVLRRRYGA